MKLPAMRLFPLLLVLALALLTFWLEQMVREDAGPHPSLRRHDPDYIVERMSLTRYGAGGGVESKLEAAKMIHYPDDDSTELIAPRIVQTKPNEPRLTVTAERGVLSQDGEEVFLYGDVRLVREGAADRPETRMHTSFLHLVRARSLARTDREIEISEQDRVLSGRGMEYYNDSRQLHLRERVRGQFEPRKKAQTAK
ncbi:MAG: LPS export ABC transporter periplasmic protein LptC [Betaproteobacteria bacterium]|nr:LPS export ABC transporter periplasmic protein LptC [Betaproteobacteria bacterium]